ncbi:MAG: LmbE family protein [Propionibacterium sp.]|nr:LmbE family protein [Propionibacterium sp.]
MRKHIGVLAAGVLTLGLAAPMAAVADPPPAGLTVEAPSVATEMPRGKIDIMGLWSHPDDDAGFTAPCGVWQDLAHVNCGIIMITRGEGGSNSVGNEAGPDLGLRRENEDRASHVRMGTVDIFNIDRADFYYNTSAPLTAQVWDDEETLRRIVRVIRETQPSILVGWPPSFKFGHGNHQYAGRLVWEAAEAAADPTRFPEQFEGLGAVEPWQVKKILDQEIPGWNPYPGEGGVVGEDCTTGFIPAADNPFTVVGTWSGYESPYVWADGNTAGVAGGTAKTWAQVGAEGGRAHPTQARTMLQDAVDPTCVRYGVMESLVPMQPNGAAGGGMDEALLFGAAVADPGGFPLETLFTFDAESYFVAPGEPFTVDVEITLPEGESAPTGTVEMQAPEGWDVSGPVDTSEGSTVDAQFTVTPAADAAHMRYRLSATFDGGDVTAYNDTRVEVVPPVEGRFERSHTSAEYDEWTEANDVYIFDRSEAVADMGVGESRTVTVEVTNRTSADESGTVELDVPAPFVTEPASVDYTLAANSSTTVDFVVTHTDPSAEGSENVEFTATTTSSGATSTEALNMYLVPTTVIPQLDSAPTIDGEADDVYTGEPIPVGKLWEGQACDPDGTDCGTGGEANLGWYDDALYAQINVVDDRASAAATYDRCFGHWLVDSVELLVDPRGDSLDTSTTFKLGMFPFTDDATGENGNGPDGPCWSRDADNHQGFSTGPLADTVLGAPNAAGVEVAMTGERNADGTWAAGGYTIEVKVPMDVLPAAVGPTSAAPTGDAATNVVDPLYLGLNITPYDSDNDDFIGETRTAWSAFGSQQSEPYRWGHAYLDGYEPPTDRATEAPEPIIPDTALMGVESPQTIYQSAVRGGTISGVQPTDAMSITGVEITEDEVVISYDTTAPGTLRSFLWSGEPSFVPVWTSSCEGDVDGFDACSVSDGQAPPWAPDMGGRLHGDGTLEVAAGSGELRVPVTAEGLAALADDGIVLISFAEAGNANGDGVEAWVFPVVEDDSTPTPTPTPTPEPTPDPTASPTPDPTSTPRPTEPPVRPGPPATGV